jgi:HTH-type transcriptional regulator/antitoxin HipB
MKILNELGNAVAKRRQSLGLQQQIVVAQAGITPESLSRFERGCTAEFGARKRLEALAVLGIEVDFLAFEKLLEAGENQPEVIRIRVRNSMVSI